MISKRNLLVIAGLALGLCGPLAAQQKPPAGESGAPEQAQPRNDAQLRKEIFENRRSPAALQRLQEQRKLLELAQNVRSDRGRPAGGGRRLPNFVTAQEAPGQTPGSDPADGQGADPADGQGAGPADGQGQAGGVPEGLPAIQADPGKQGQIVSIGDGDIPMRDFLKFLADFTGLTVIVDSANPTFLQQPVTIVAPIQRANEEVIRAILQANQVRLFRKKLEEGTEIIMIQPMTPTGQQGKDPEERIIVYQDELDAAASEALIKPDQFATMVFTLEYISPADAIEALQNLVGGTVSAAGARGAVAGARGGGSFSMVEIKNTEKLIITAKFGLLDYLRKLLDLIDVPLSEPERIIDIRQIEYADAGEIEQILTQFLQGGRGSSFSRFTQRSVTQPRTTTPTTRPSTSTAGGRQNTDFSTKLISDLRTNQLVIETYSEQDLQDIDMLIGYLDVKFTLRRVKTHIYQVRYLKAVEVAQDLQLLLQGQGSAGLGGLSRTRTRSTTSARSTLPRISGGGATPAAGAQTGAPGNQEIASLIVPHEPTNSLLIQAEREDYDQILNILSRIDTKRRQVFLEAALVQVKSSSNLTFAIDLLAGEPDDRATRGLFATQFTNPPLTAINPETFDREFIPEGGVPIGGIFALMHRGDFPLLIQFFKEHDDSQILATPFILADDNEPNSIEILETRFVTNTSQQPNQTTLSTQQGEPAGITLSIEPTISGSQRAVFLVMDLSVSEFDDSRGALTPGGLAPKNENTMASSVTIPDGKIFVVGGLTRENNSKSVQKVPILGDIPLLGKLFRREVTSRSKNNLYVFLQAHILTDEEFDDGTDLTQQAREQIRTVTDEEVDPIKFSAPDIERRPATDPDDDFDRVFDLNDPSAALRRRYDDYRSNVEGEGNQRDRSGQAPYNNSSGPGAGRIPETYVPTDGPRTEPPPVPPPAPGGGEKKSSGWFD